ncbi:Uncharacterised protein [Porphyromonas crevioricanis]|uniref:Uncharacterized protein n=1 Tax=Porphyromonas crevioricanis TaxID=393921 RepID=A0A2X4PWZ2_9PORP|nr:Uncharacterised protein [Porphyromonas crevioricanis]
MRLRRSLNLALKKNRNRQKNNPICTIQKHCTTFAVFKVIESDL